MPITKNFYDCPGKKYLISIFIKYPIPKELWEQIRLAIRLPFIPKVNNSLELIKKHDPTNFQLWKNSLKKIKTYLIFPCRSNCEKEENDEEQKNLEIQKEINRNPNLIRMKINPLNFYYGN